MDAEDRKMFDKAITWMPTREAAEEVAGNLVHGVRGRTVYVYPVYLVTLDAPPFGIENAGEVSRFTSEDAEVGKDG